MPVFSIGGEKSLGNALAQQMKLVATNVTVVVLEETGHSILEENPKATIDALMTFLKDPFGKGTASGVQP
jgi:pimeloyl-ACP methyl ester carboxylesterase